MPATQGMNNRVPDRGVPDGQVRNGVNIDFHRDGSFATRKGGEKVYSALGVHSGYSCPSGTFFVEGNRLRSLSDDDTASTLYSGISGTECSYAYLNDTVYFSDGSINLKIKDGAAMLWGMQAPPEPVLSRVSGTYPAGVYIALYCWVDYDGAESPPSPMAYITVPANSGFYFVNLPSATDPQVYSLRIYLSVADGKELYHVTDIRR